MADAKWYVVQTYSGYENTVKATIEKTVENRQLQDKILVISIPTETVTEKTEKGELKTYERKLFPSYVLVKMIYTNEVWHLIKNIRGVTGFLGDTMNKDNAGANKEPIPLTEEEVYAMGMEKREVILDYKIGDTVKISEGVYSGQTATVEDIDVDNSEVHLSVRMFNRQIPLSLPLDAVELESQ